MKLLNQTSLAASPVVANCRMNRERLLASYAKELSVDPLPFLRSAALHGQATWLDVCCGSGRALVDAAKQLTENGPADNLLIEGVDLVGMFDANPFPKLLSLRIQSLEDWMPYRAYTLVTCVHGLHYVGDKLAAICKLVANLDDDGLFVANLDLAGFRFADGRAAGRQIACWLRDHRMQYDTRRRLIRCQGPRHLKVPFRYLGADDQVGPNYTGQPAVASYYERAS